MQLYLLGIPYTDTFPEKPRLPTVSIALQRKPRLLTLSF
jgi:hypothetical protein